jgi:hypothetical protein
MVAVTIAAAVVYNCVRVLTLCQLVVLLGTKLLAV